MKNPIEIEADTILVAIEDQNTTCGINYIKQGSVLKVAKFKPEWRDNVRVFRNAKAEEDYNWHSIDLDKVRLATKIEEEMWNKEMYFVESVKTI